MLKKHIAEFEAKCDVRGATKTRRQTKLTLEQLMALWSQHGKPNPPNPLRTA